MYSCSILWDQWFLDLVWWYHMAWDRFSAPTLCPPLLISEVIVIRLDMKSRNAWSEDWAFYFCCLGFYRSRDRAFTYAFRGFIDLDIEFYLHPSGLYQFEDQFYLCLLELYWSKDRILLVPFGALSIWRSNFTYALWNFTDLKIELYLHPSELYRSEDQILSVPFGALSIWRLNYALRSIIDLKIEFYLCPSGLYRSENQIFTYAL